MLVGRFRDPFVITGCCGCLKLPPTDLLNCSFILFGPIEPDDLGLGNRESRPGGELEGSGDGVEV